MKLKSIAATAIAFFTCCLAYAAAPTPAKPAAPAAKTVTAPAPAPAPVVAAAPAAAPEVKINTAELARKIVRAANLREKDLVTVRGGERDNALLDDIALEVAKS